MYVTYGTNTNSIPEEFWVVFGLIFAIVMFFVLIISVITMIGQWKVFQKAGKPGWAAIIPIYNMWVLYEIGGIKPVFCLFTVAGGFLTGFGNTMNFMGQSSGNSIMVLVGLLANLVSIACSMTGLVFTIMCSLNIAKYFKKSAAFGIGLAFLSFVFYPILGFGKTDKYEKID